jgi:hypothetical protein
MAWALGTAREYNIGRQADETFPALINNQGAELLHIGLAQNGSTRFAYHNNLVDFSFGATRNAEFHGPTLRNDGKQFTETWTVNFRDFMIRPKSGVALSPQLLTQIKSDIEAALLSHPLWPSSQWRPDLPAKFVKFIAVN